jgi:hypothetical protein
VRLLKRLLHRLLVFGLGVLCVWLIAFVFRFTDHRLPTILALAVTYGIAAYIILPRAVRMGLKILQRKRVPRFTLTGDGLPGDPVNLVLMGTLQQLRSAFTIAGWTEADRLDLASSWRMVRAFVFNSPYPSEYLTRRLRSRHPKGEGAAALPPRMSRPSLTSVR